MASTQAALQPAPWRDTFLDHVNNHTDQREFVLSSLHRSASGESTSYVPRARYCIFRGMWAELPENKHNDAPKNDRVYESDLPTFTTDVRMEKVDDFFGGTATSNDIGSGGGRPVEAVWWMKDKMVQWRVKGEAFVVGPDIEGKGDESTGAKNVKSEISKRLRVVDEANRASWSWQTELTAHFGNVSPAMRGTFKQPPPGRPVLEPYDSEHEKMGEKIEDLHEQTARKHFRVVIIRPEEVEMLNLDEPKRLQYVYDDRTGEWTEREVWP